MLKTLYDEYFGVRDGENISEKVLLTRLTVGVSLILMCLIAMSVSAFAFFSADQSSKINTIKPAHFDAEVVVTNLNGEQMAVYPLTNGNRGYFVNLMGETAYRVTVTNSGDTTTGFCVLSAEGGDGVYHTHQLWKDEGLGNKSISFDVKLTEGSTLYILPHWGTSSHYDAYKNQGVDSKYYIDNGDTIVITVDPAKAQELEAPKPLVPEQETEKSETTDVIETTSNGGADTSELTKALETTASPETTAVSETTAVPEETNIPETEISPETTEAAQVTEAPEQTTAPETEAQTQAEIQPEAAQDEPI